MKKIVVAFGLDESGELANKHYGDSDKFAIYEFYEDGTYKLIEYRENKAIDIEEEEHEHHGDPRKFKVVISQLKDVDVLAGYWFGPNLVRIRKSSNKVPFLTKTRSLNEAIKKIKTNFDEIWRQVEEKRRKIK